MVNYSQIEFTDTNQKQLLGDLWNFRKVGPAIVIGVYEGPVPGETTSLDVNKLFPGQIRVRFNDEENMNAWVIVPYGLRPDTQQGEEGKTSQNREERPFNQYFGFYAMPRIGDTVFIIGMSTDTFETATQYFALGSVFRSGASRPPLTDKEDLQIVHRSGASIRLNDTYVGGGSITTEGTESDDYMNGLTGNLTLIGNRTIMLTGTRYLAHGLMAKYGDPRERFSNAGIETFQGIDGGVTYNGIFSNSQTDMSKYFDPFTDETLGNIGDKYFLSPPTTTDVLIPLTDNTLLLSQHGGGMFRVDDHNADSDYSRMTMAASSMSLFVGEDYRDMGLQGKSTEFDNGVSGIGEGESGYGPVGTGSNTFELQHKKGTRITIDEDGAIYITTQDPSAKIMIDTKDSGASIDIGMANKAAVKEGDESYTGTAKGADLSMGSYNTIGNLGLPVPHVHAGHTHTAKATQDKVYI